MTEKIQYQPEIHDKLFEETLADALASLTYPVAARNEAQVIDAINSLYTFLEEKHPKFVITCESPYQANWFIHFCEKKDINKIKNSDELKKQLFSQPPPSSDEQSNISFVRPMLDMSELRRNIVSKTCIKMGCTEMYPGLTDLADKIYEQLFCVWVYKDIAFACYKPPVIRWAEEELHCEDGPAVKFSDGYSMYCWHGFQVPGQWIENRETLDPFIALTWENIEQRRCAAEIIGWDKVLSHPSLSLKLIQEDPDPEIGKLVKVNLPDVGESQFLIVRCGTGRNFAIPCPPEMKTAHEANAWTWGLTVHEYQPEVRT